MHAVVLVLPEPFFCATALIRFSVDWLVAPPMSPLSTSFPLAPAPTVAAAAAAAVAAVVPLRALVMACRAFRTTSLARWRHATRTSSRKSEPVKSSARRATASKSRDGSTRSPASIFFKMSTLPDEGAKGEGSRAKGGSDAEARRG